MLHSLMHIAHSQSKFFYVNWSQHGTLFSQELWI